jgi:CRISPR system Cascade subunit CasD
MSNNYLLLWFEAPLQTWGADSKFGRRDTLPFPTKSGVLGLVLCAMGASGPQNELLAKLNSGALQIASYVRSRPGVDGEALEKINMEPLLRDFHMVGSGYDDKKRWERLLIPKTSEEKAAVGAGSSAGAKMTYRYYLQDARFAIVWEVPEDMAQMLADALQNPVFDLYFGRKNCVPSARIFEGFYATAEEAWQKASIIANEKLLLEDFRVLDGEHEGDMMTLNDVPIQFGEVKKYRDRRVTKVPS